MNRMTTFPRLLLASAVLAAAPAFAADPPPEGVWTGKGQLGYVGTQGNTDSKSLNAGLDLALVDASWKHAAHLAAIYGQQNGITSASRWDAGWQSDYKFSERLFAFGALRYDNDKYGPYSEQKSVTAGVGYKVVDDADFKLTGQLGAGYREAQLQQLTRNAAGAVIARSYPGKESGAVVTAGLDYWQQLTKTTTLTDKLVVEKGSDNTLTTNALALQVKISDKLALGLGYSIVHNSTVPAPLPGQQPVKHLDSTETVNLVYSF